MSSYRLLPLALLCFAIAAHAEEVAPASEAPAATEAAPASVPEASATTADPATATTPAEEAAPAEAAPAVEPPVEPPATPAPETAPPEAAPVPDEAPSAAPERPRIDIRMPARGMTMDEVENQFGAPQNKRPAVGEPPITRWVFADYTVYFERQYVIHTVLNERPSTP